MTGPVAPASAPGKGHRPMPGSNDFHAVIIGISKYFNIRNLPYVDDAKDVGDALRDPEVCGFAHVASLGEGEATREAILGALDDLAGGPSKGSVLIYFSGHG